MRVVMFGSGAVGGYFGAQLARAGHPVTLIARGPHLEAIRTRGLTVQSPMLGDFTVQVRAESDPATVGPVDVVIVAIKTYDNASAYPMIAPLLGPDTVVLTLQNGVDNVDQLAALYGEARVLGGTTYVATALEASGRIVQTGVHRSIIFGEVFGARGLTPRVEALVAALSMADIEVRAVPDARTPLWDKFVYLVPFSGFTGAARLPIGFLWSSPQARDMFYAAAREVSAIAHAEGITLSPDRWETLQHYMDHIPHSTRSSLLIDLSQQKRIEVEALQGVALRKAAAHGVPTPIIATLYAALRPWAVGTPQA
ncbi:MAG: 2-dehydropantoate 2-reductase [Acidobacteria bacterium]|nr:2-dehydropantoate 2-reductase [Acidobacteriota bacterium]